MPNIIRVEYSLHSLNGISPTAFEAELHDALKARWPGTLVNVVQSINDRCWGEQNGAEVPEDEISRITQDVFEKLCRQ